VSARTTDLEVAKCKLKDVEGRVARDEPVLPRADGLKYDHLRDDLRVHYETTGSRDLDEADFRFAHLDPFFKNVRAVAIDRPLIARYVQHRQHEGASNGTIRQELGVLSRMLNLAHENNRLVRVPSLRGLKPAEAKPRQGFFERDQFASVVRRLPDDLQVAVAVSYAFGWRTQSEVLTLERRHLDLKAKTLRLDPGSTKNGEGRTVSLPDDVAALLAQQLARVEIAQRTALAVIPWLFPHLSGPARLGQRRKDFRKVWGHGLPKGGALRAAAARSTPDGSARYGARRHPARRGDADHRTQDRGDVPALRDRERGRPPRGGAQAHWHSFWHSRPPSA